MAKFKNDSNKFIFDLYLYLQVQKIKYIIKYNYYTYVNNN